MNPILNPYSPGAGIAPPELTGRDDIINRVRVAIGRARIGNSNENVMIVGVRGVGKTVLLDYMRMQAEADGCYCLRMESPECRSLPGLIAPELRKALVKLSRVSAAKDLAIRGLRGLAGFSEGLKVRYNDIEVALDFSPEGGLADNGDLETDLQDLFSVVGQAARAAKTCVCILIDEMQYIPNDELGALISLIHYSAQRRLPIVFVGSGLPQLRAKMGLAKTYSERLFSFPAIGSLDVASATKAVVEPARRLGVEYAEDALNEILSVTQGYPYFLQEWGKYSWGVAEQSPITLSDVRVATRDAVAELDASFFLVRFDRFTPLEKKYLRAMAELNPGSRTSGRIAQIMGRKVQSISATRNSLIEKGAIWSPAYSENLFTAPLFDDFLKRVMPKL